MATTIYELRKKPQLVFTLNENDFHLIDNDNPSNNGEFKFNSVVSIDLVKRKTNWAVSIFSLVVDFIFDYSSFDNYKEKDKLFIQLKKAKIEILLFKVDKKEVEELISNLKESIKY
jgi:hypothetical protein